MAKKKNLQGWQKKRDGTHKILIVVLCEEVLQAAGPVAAPAQQAERPLLAAHVAVPRVLLDGGMRRPLAHQQVHALHAEAPERVRGQGRKPRLILEVKRQKTSRSLFLGRAQRQRRERKQRMRERR